MKINELLSKDLTELCHMANKVRESNVGDIVHIRALLEISNICSRNCDYCGLRSQNGDLKRYAMGISDIESLAKKAYDTGYKTIVLQSGESNHYDIGEFAEMVARISDLGIIVTLSLGELAYNELKLLKDAGAKRYLLKFETSDSTMYERLHKGYTLGDRLDCLSAIKSLGYEVGSGFLVGLPGETEQILAQNLELVKKFECDMVGIGVFIPHKNTPLAKLDIGSSDMTKKCVAITRLLLPNCNIPITTSLSEFDGKFAMFDGGANVIMQNITPTDFANEYQIYPKKRLEFDIKKDRINLEKQLTQIGRKPL